MSFFNVPLCHAVVAAMAVGSFGCDHRAARTVSQRGSIVKPDEAERGETGSGRDASAREDAGVWAGGGRAGGRAALSGMAWSERLIFTVPALDGPDAYVFILTLESGGVHGYGHISES